MFKNQEDSALTVTYFQYAQGIQLMADDKRNKERERHLKSDLFRPFWVTSEELSQRYNADEINTIIAKLKGGEINIGQSEQSSKASISQENINPPSSPTPQIPLVADGESESENEAGRRHDDMDLDDSDYVPSQDS